MVLDQQRRQLFVRSFVQEEQNNNMPREFAARDSLIEFVYWFAMNCRYFSETNRLAAHSNTNI